MSDTCSNTKNGISLSIQGKPIVAHDSYIDLVMRDGSDEVVIGRVRATFDLTTVPDDLTLIVLSSLISGGQRWHVGAVAQGRDYLVIERRSLAPPEPKDPAAWWDIRRWFR